MWTTANPGQCFRGSMWWAVAPSGLWSQGRVYLILLMEVLVIFKTWGKVSSEGGVDYIKRR